MKTTHNWTLSQKIEYSPIPAWFIISWVHSSSSINDPPRLSSQFRLLIFLFMIGPKHTRRRRCDFPTLTQGSHSAQSPHLKPPWTFPFPASVRPNCVSSNINDALITSDYMWLMILSDNFKITPYLSRFKRQPRK